ncbi:uncharacterized protein EI90DRAFT_3019156 [Cantharellus anzutake]|uniref:uncharacterized protein n=1 Tax=Cantharellus anzutake TaxID=1750568 RepID=UPI001906A79C|nr:uncharacterized protein EI90DRAFT_3019156 [Cantharellus anzutake]KAF8325180.1 hypothetical protein EI90DRAFT_3019156 [Cantharellus anzutake]
MCVAHALKGCFTYLSTHLTSPRYQAPSAGEDCEGREDAPNDTAHPLQCPAIDLPTFASSIKDGTLTRPGLRRKLRPVFASDAYTPESASSSLKELRNGKPHPSATSTLDGWTNGLGATGSSTEPTDAAPGNTREVYVHEIMPADSLESVALKYGIKVAALRKANKLWPTDSIHLRKVLYIPVDWQKAKDSIFDADEAFAAPSSSKLSGERAIREFASSATRRHVPLSELSFFPPGAHQLACPEERPGVFSMLRNEIERLSWMSTDSLAHYSTPRASFSDDGVGTSASAQSEVEVELDVARDTWRKSGVHVWQRNGSPELPKAPASKISFEAPVPGAGPPIVKRQPGETPQMSIFRPPGR